MAVDLYGDTYVDNWDYARKIVTLGMGLPFYKVFSYELLNDGLGMSLHREGTFFRKADITGVNGGGLYVLYEKTKTQTSCLYVGATEYSMRQRVYRFMKELHDVSRDDEKHPAATKARFHGVTPNCIYAKFMPIRMMPKMKNLRIDFMTLDETCAILLKSRYNVRRTY
jgi:hypothetical protein